MALLFCLSLALLWSIRPGSVPDTEASIPAVNKPTADLSNATAPAAPEPPAPVREVENGLIQPGDTLSALLGDHLTPQQIYRLSEDSRSVFPLTRICAGQAYELRTVDGSFESFTYDIDREEQLIIARVDDQFLVRTVPIEYEVKIDKVAGTIETSLFESISDVGEDPDLAVALADIFAWDIDFIRDIRSGDSYQALIERRYREGEPAGYGRILAAEFTNQGHQVRAVLFQDGDKPPSYYDPDGHSMRKAFLKAPLSFTRISSGFSYRRLHPVTNALKPHLAIDYAAPTGTPIKTVGDGVVIAKGYSESNGNYIKIRHNSVYETSYIHMSRFARGMKKGRKVTQGEIIGFVGATGIATGPHLDFRMYKNGSPINPLREKAIPSEPVSGLNSAAFQALAAERLTRFEASEPRFVMDSSAEQFSSETHISHKP